MAHPPLCDDIDLPSYGLSWEFLEQFRPRPLVVEITVAGALGTMRWRWRWSDAEAWSDPVLSSTTAPNVVRVEEAYAVLSFAAGTYVADKSYEVSEAGEVTPGSGALDALTASRFDLRALHRQAATDDALGWMAPKVVPPLTAWGSDLRSHVARLVAVRLKKIRGIAPRDVGLGDGVLLDDEERMEKWFRAVGDGFVKLQDLVDSSAGGRGGGLLAYPSSREPRGW